MWGACNPHVRSQTVCCASATHVVDVSVAVDRTSVPSGMTSLALFSPSSTILTLTPQVFADVIPGSTHASYGRLTPVFATTPFHALYEFTGADMASPQVQTSGEDREYRTQYLIHAEFLNVSHNCIGCSGSALTPWHGTNTIVIRQVISKPVAHRPC
jgi:hypothetical protein